MTNASLRTVHYVGFRDDRYWSALRVFGGPRMIHRRWDRRAQRDIGPDDVVMKEMIARFKGQPSTIGHT